MVCRKVEKGKLVAELEKSGMRIILDAIWEKMNALGNLINQILLAWLFLWHSRLYEVERRRISSRPGVITRTEQFVRLAGRLNRDIKSVIILSVFSIKTNGGHFLSCVFLQIVSFYRIYFGASVGAINRDRVAKEVSYVGYRNSLMCHANLISRD